MAFGGLGAQAAARARQNLGCAGRAAGHRRLAEAHRRGVPGAAGHARRRGRHRRSPSAARACSICRARSGCAMPALRQRWYPHSPAVARRLAYGLTERQRRRAAERAAGRVRRVLPDGGGAGAPAAAWAGCSSRAIIIDAKSGISGRRQDADRADALLGVPRQPVGVRRVRHRHAAEIEQELGVPVTFVPHLRAARPRHPRDDLRDGCARASTRRRWRGAATRAYAAAPFVRLTGARSAGDQARRPHQLLRHRVAGGCGRRPARAWSSASTTSSRGRPARRAIPLVRRRSQRICEALRRKVA